MTTTTPPLSVGTNIEDEARAAEPLLVEPTAAEPEAGWRAFLALAAIAALLVAVAVAFAWPWWPRPAPGGEALARYAPAEDGMATLSVKYDAGGELMQWTSSNQQVLSSGRAVAADLREAQVNAIEKLYLREGETDLDADELAPRLGTDQIERVYVRELGAGGAISDSVNIFLRDAAGLHIIGFYDVADQRDFIFDPPILSLPANPAPGESWGGEGRVNDEFSYRTEARVVEAGPFESEIGDFDDCIRTEVRFVLFEGEQTFSDRTSDEWYCAGVGLVESRSFESGGDPVERVVVVGTDRFPADPGALPPPVEMEAADTQPPADSGEWQLSRVARMGQTIAAHESTISPVWIPTDPPALLAATLDGDLVAFDAGDPTGRILWRFHPEGTVFSPPAFDPERGRIYFGASDKKLYALDARGLFLWAVPTGDNVATRPVVADDVVIFGSEDRAVYGVDALSGRLLWRKDTGDAVVSSPVVAQGVAVIGTDGGVVYGLDPATGEERWAYAAGDAVEAPVVAAGGVVYAAGRDGNLYALDAATGEERWVGKGGYTLRTAPALAPDRLFIVDDFGRLLVFDRQSGRRLAVVEWPELVGPPAVVGDRVLVASEDGPLYAFDFDGVVQARWPAEGSTGLNAQPGGTDLGLAPGADAVWLADEGATVWRLGPGRAGAAALSLAWIDTVSDEPFQLQLLSTTPVVYQGGALALDSAGTIYLVEPETGTAARLGQIGEGEGGATVDPVVAGNTLLTVSPPLLRATRLPDGRSLWEFEGSGLSLRPPVVAGDTILWLTQPSGDPGTQTATLYALDLASGEVRWRERLDAFLAGGVTASDDTVFASTPPAAFDLATGEPRWWADVEGNAVGGPALDPEGETLFVGVMGDDGNSGAVVAIETAGGTVRWQVPTGEEVLSPIERLHLSGDMLIMPSISGAILGLDATTGDEVWRYRPDVAPIGTVTVEGGRVWLVLENSQVVALDAATGQVVARFADLEMNLTGVGVSQRPLVLENRVIVPIGVSLLGFELPE